MMLIILIQILREESEMKMKKKVNLEDNEFNVPNNEFLCLYYCYNYLLNKLYFNMKQARITRLHPILSPPKNEEVTSVLIMYRLLFLIHVLNFKKCIILNAV